MNQAKTLVSIIFLVAAFAFGGRFSYAQGAADGTAPDADYEAVLYVVLGSAEAQPGATEVPKGLTNVFRSLRDSFQHKNYSLVNTYFGRVANNGNLEYKSVSNIYGVESNPDVPSFLDWRLAGLKSGTGTSSNSLRIQMFRFGARVPVRVASFDQSGKASPVLNYESVGLTLDRIGVIVGNPTLVGTITLPKTTGTMFLVLNVTPAA